MTKLRLLNESQEINGRKSTFIIMWAHECINAKGFRMKATIPKLQVKVGLTISKLVVMRSVPPLEFALFRIHK